MAGNSWLQTDAASTNVDMNQPQGKQFRSVDSQRESRNQPAARAVRVLVPRSLRIRMLCLFTAYKAMGILSLVLRLVGESKYSAMGIDEWFVPRLKKSIISHQLR